MRWPRFAVLVIVTMLLQASWVDLIAVTRLNVAPDLLLTAMVFFAIRCSTTEAIISSFALGLAADIVATGFPMGPRVISFGLFGTGLAYLRHVITIKKMPYEALAIFIMGLCTGILARMLTLLAGRSSGWGGFGALAGSSVYSAVIGPFMFMLLDWVMRVKNRHSGRG